MGGGQEVNKSMVIAIIVVVVIAACIGGYFIFIAPNSNGVSDSTKSKYMDKMNSGGGPASNGAPTRPSSGGK